jgi:ABC-type sulfate/molybdate transport systems ATPase subunit
LTPLEIVTAAESLATDVVGAATDLPEDRALALLTHLRQSTLADLIAAPIDDGVGMELLDGVEFKPTDRLSIGQRCTVVLPMLLAAEESILVVDQPEDHLDNAYVTSTLVERLRGRGPSQQLLFSSHNPNIPVLGEADQVIVMGSDGAHGFALHQGNLDDPKVVFYVTSLLEGGEEAFRLRAQFYSRAWKA